MKIDDMTIGDLKQINSLINNNAINKKNIFNEYIGKYVICRTRNEGINVGFVKNLDETGVILTQCRRLWYYLPKDNSKWYEGVAQIGLNEDSKISEPTEKIIVENYSLTIISEEAKQQIIHFPSTKR